MFLQKRARAREEGSSSQAGIPLLTSFPYRRLTLEQIDQLFQVYGIHLGHSNQDRLDIITAMQTLDRPQFEVVIKNLLQQTKSVDRVNKVILDRATFLTMVRVGSNNDLNVSL